MMVCMTRQWILAAARPTRYRRVSLPDHRMRPRRSTVVKGSLGQSRLSHLRMIQRHTREAQVRQERKDEVSDHLREYSFGEETVTASMMALWRAIQSVSN